MSSFFYLLLQNIDNCVHIPWVSGNDIRKFDEFRSQPESKENSSPAFEHVTDSLILMSFETGH